MDPACVLMSRSAISAASIRTIAPLTRKGDLQHAVAWLDVQLTQHGGDQLRLGGLWELVAICSALVAIARHAGGWRR
jgi:hypothetical protein